MPGAISVGIFLDARRAGGGRGVMFRILLTALTIITFAAFGASEVRAASIVVEADTGYVLKAEEADVLWHPASLTKMMTVLLVFEALEAGDLELSDILEVSRAAAAQPPTELGLSAGQKLSVDTAISATILRSANDAAVVLAEALAGTEVKFAERMTARAGELGMSSTQYRNATGLPHAEQITTARDMAVLARHMILKVPGYLGYFADTSMDYGKRRLPSINGFLTAYDGALGMKTGFTCASGYNIVASAARGDRTVVGVLLGARNGAGRAAGIRRLMNAGFATGWEEDAPPATLASYVTEERARKGPPTVIPQSECGPTTPKPAATPQVVASHDESLPGWGILIGAFNARGQAESAAKQNRARLAGVGRAATPVVVERREGRARGFSALLVNLSREQAQGACSLLRKTKSYCLALGPTALNNPRALWR